MNTEVLLAVLIIGFATGLRGLTPPAVIAWCSYFGCLNLGTTPFSFMASPVAVAILSLSAVGEYGWDLLPNTPSRTAPPGLISRILSGSFSSACLLAVTNYSLAFCTLGGIAAIAGAFVGVQIRTRLVKALGVKDAAVAIPEDLVAIGLALGAVCLIAPA